MSKARIEATTFQRWRNKGIEVIAPTYTSTFFTVLAGAKTVRQVAESIGMAETTASGHLKRLRGWGLVDWSTSRANTIHPTYEIVHVPAVEEGSVLALFDWEWPGADEVTLPDHTITNVMDLRKGDRLTYEGDEYPVKEVRKAKRNHHASVRLSDPSHDRGEFWIRVPLDDAIEGRRTVEAQNRLAQVERRDDEQRTQTTGGGDGPLA